MAETRQIRRGSSTRTVPGSTPTLRTLLLLAAVAALALPAADAAAEQASQPASAAAGQLDVSGGPVEGHTCALLSVADLRCWGFGGSGRLGYGNTSKIGDDETPGSAGPVGLGQTVKAISAGAYHTCAVLEDGTVRCWGFGGDGRLGYPSAATPPTPIDVGDDETLGSVGPVDLSLPIGVGPEDKAKAISAGGGHTCAVLQDDTVRCWGFGGDGRLGYPSTATPPRPPPIGDDETPGSAGPVDLRPPVGVGPEDKAKAISAGDSDTCAVLADDSVRCWGLGANGQLGYGDTLTVGDDETPGSVGPVDLRPPMSFGPEDKAKAISAGAGHTCAVVLEDDSVRCWGYGGNGRLGYANTNTINPPRSAGPVDLRLPIGVGPEDKAKAISTGDSHTCAVLDDDTVRCWGYDAEGRLGYATTNDIGDDETPGSFGPVALGPGRTAQAISAGGRHTCARLDDNSVRCWGYGGSGRLGYCNEVDIGDNETPGSVGPVDIGGGGAGCATSGSPTDVAGPPPAGDMNKPSGPGGAQAGSSDDSGLASQARRARGLRTCLAGVERRARDGRKSARSRSARARVERKRSAGRRACLKRYGRTPGRVTGLRARAVSKTRIMLSFRAAGTDGTRPPAARTDGTRPPAARAYLVKQSLRPIRGARDFSRAQALCKGSCRFPVTRVGANVNLTITDLRPRTAYYYAIEARDNVSGRLGARSKTVRATTPR